MTAPRPILSTRRTLLTGTGISALALGTGALAAGCSQQPPTPTTQPGTEPAPPAGTTDAPEATTAPGTEQPSPTSTGLQVAAASVPVGGGLVLEDADYVVTQPEAGQFKAFSKICTHQGCPVSEVAESRIVCFCHGSAFSITDGSVLQGPAEEPLAETAVAAADGQLTIG